MFLKAVANEGVPRAVELTLQEALSSSAFVNMMERMGGREMVQAMKDLSQRVAGTVSQTGDEIAIAARNASGIENSMFTTRIGAADLSGLSSKAPTWIHGYLSPTESSWSALWGNGSTLARLNLGLHRQNGIMRVPIEGELSEASWIVRNAADKPAMVHLHFPNGVKSPEISHLLQLDTKALTARDPVTHLGVKPLDNSIAYAHRSHLR